MTVLYLAWKCGGGHRGRTAYMGGEAASVVTARVRNHHRAKAPRCTRVPTTGTAYPPDHPMEPDPLDPITRQALPRKHLAWQAQEFNNLFCVNS